MTTAPDTTAMLELLERIGAPALVQQFLKDVLPRDYRGTEGPALSKLASRLGWEAFAEWLTRFVSVQLPDSPTADLAATVAIVEGLCCNPGQMTAQRQTVCRAVAAQLEHTIRNWDAPKAPAFTSTKIQG